MKAGIAKEEKLSMDAGTFKIILLEEIPPDAKILPGRFVLAIKSTKNNQIKYKARFVIGGHRDNLKQLMVHNTPILQPQFIRLLLALAVSHGFDTWTSDVIQVFFQSAVSLLRDIFLTKDIPEFDLKPAQAMSS